MKLSAFLAVTVPIVAMSTYTPALATNDSDPNAWLKESVASLKAPAKSVAAKKVSHAAPVAVAKGSGSSAPTLKLRPFVPNRFLPSERDIQRQQLIAQQAQMDMSSANPESAYGGGRSLSGAVNAYGMRQQSAYDQYSSQYSSVEAAAVQAPRIKPARQVVSRAPRVVPNQMPMLPEQLTQGSAIKPIIPEPPAQHSAKAHFPMSMPVAVIQQPQTANSQQPAQIQLPPISPEQQAQLQRLVEQNRPTATMNFNGEIIGEGSDNPNTGIGQPPFPLNLLPMNAMKTLASTHHKSNAPDARFGSWHATPAGGLPQAGFHSYLPYRKPTPYEYIKAPSTLAKKKTHMVASHKVKPVAPHVVAEAPAPIVHPAVATYPTIFSEHGLSY